MPEFRKKPVVIEAHPWQDDMTAELRDWFGTSEWTHDLRNGNLHIHTLEGVMTADVGDWIIRGVAGEFYPCKPDIFAATYEPVVSASVAAGRAAATPDPPLSEGDAVSSQLEDAFNEAVERRTAELRAALEFYANADNYVGGEVGWWADAPGGEHRWCMDFGSIARSALVSPDRPPFFTEQQERALARCEGYDEARAASPDERLREAGEAMAASIRELGRPIGTTTGGRWGRAKKSLDAWVAVLAAADREAPKAALDAVYAERNAVVLGLAKAGLMLGWRVGRASDPNEPDWPVIYIDTPAGQVSWHFRAANVPDWVEPYPGEWDRHSDAEKYERLARIVPAPASPDERLREALLSDAAVEAAAMTYEPDTFIGDAPNADDALRDARAVLEAALAAADREAHLEPAPQNDVTRAQIVAAKLIADREAPDEPKETTT